MERLILGFFCGILGISGLLPPEPPKQEPLTPYQMRIKAKYKSISRMCERKNRKSEQAKAICKRWRTQHA